MLLLNFCNHGEKTETASGPYFANAETLWCKMQPPWKGALSVCGHKSLNVKKQKEFI